jgi:hypothetical protein
VNPVIYHLLTFVGVCCRSLTFTAWVLAALLALTSCVEPVTRATPDPSPAKGHPAATPAVQNRSVRQPNALTHEKFLIGKEQARHKQSPSADLPSFKQFATDLTAVDERIPEDKKAPIYTAIFDQAGIRPTPDRFPGLNPQALGPNAATLSQAYRKFPEKQRELSKLLEKLKADPTKIPVADETMNTSEPQRTEHSAIRIPQAAI